MKLPTKFIGEYPNVNGRAVTKFVFYTPSLYILATSDKSGVSQDNLRRHSVSVLVTKIISVLPIIFRKSNNPPAKPGVLRM